ncbi:PQQ-dependent sugar dehydrogenase [Streptomyces huasconensis]|uniref:PQQ-dependent sugar dehydrogenase n=1 Tax=Streptomyces huasconensis TaxID=1854574 RepID=A0ABV3M0T5_9ACTN
MRGDVGPQLLRQAPGGRLWEAELGDSKRDELNLIKPGGNYRWLTCEGACGVAGLTDPKKTWPVADASPSGIAVVDGAVYLAALRGKRLWRVPINADNEDVGDAKAYYVGEYGRLRSITAVPGADELWR